MLAEVLRRSFNIGSGVLNSARGCMWDATVDHQVQISGVVQVLRWMVRVPHDSQ